MNNQATTLTEKPSTTLQVSVLSDVYDFLYMSNCHVDLLLKVRVAMENVIYAHDAESYWQQWLMAHADKNINSLEEAKTMFIMGFNFCREESEYVFTKSA